MMLPITEDDLISNIQSDFHKEYPWLQLVFFKNPHIPGEACPAVELLDPVTPIEDIRMFHCAGAIDISPERLVADVEYDFYHQMGLAVQVQKCTGATWLPATGTNVLSLAEQNENGRRSTLPVKEEREDGTSNNVA